VCCISHSFGVLASPRLCANGARRRSDVKYDARVIFVASQKRNMFRFGRSHQNVMSTAEIIGRDGECHGIAGAEF
jgi:hypothetical protein